MEANECVMTPFPESPAEPPPEDAEPERKKKTIRISFYFDGTGNNRKNTQTRLDATDKENPRDPQGTYKKILEADTWRESSYFNDFSNVARLYKYAKISPGYDHHFRVYVEGIGTIDDDEDSLFGNAMGKQVLPWLEDTGVIARVEKGLADALGRVVKMYRPPKHTLAKVTVDTFGFSRGATAARYCIQRVLEDVSDPKLPSFKNRLVQTGYEVGTVEVKAVGIYDTVSAFGNAYWDTSDVRTLYLDAVRKAQAVYHLAAAEEYRHCFSLTNIDSAVSSGKGVQIFLPGAHSDVGGGYVHDGGENKVIWTNDGSESIQDFLEIYGWAQRHQTKIIGTWDLRERREDVAPEKPDGTGRKVRPERLHLANADRYLRLTRSPISNRYSFIPLRLMAAFTREQNLVIDAELENEFDPSKDDPETKSGRLPPLMISRIMDYANRAKSTHDSLPEDWMKRDAEQKRFRNRYLHFSAASGPGLVLRTNQLGDIYDPVRRIWSDNA